MQRSTEQLTRCSTITLDEATENTNNVTATRTVSQKIMSVCKRSIRWIYVADLIFILTVALLLGILEFNLVPHQTIGFSCNDPKISFKFTGDTISINMLVISSIVLPLVMMGLVEFIFRPADTCEKSQSPGRISRHKQFWYWYGHYTVWLTLLTLICTVMKMLIGEPRPHFLDTCKPREAANCTDEYISSYTCTNTELSHWFVNDSSKSFPSGHSALATFTCVFLMWYLQNRLPNRTLLLKPWLQGLLAIWAAVCCLTRVSDNRHHWWDVLAGFFLGGLFSLFLVAVPCRHFHSERVAANITVVPTHALNDLENGQIGGYNMQRKHNIKKLLNSGVVDVSE